MSDSALQEIMRRAPYMTVKRKSATREEIMRKFSQLWGLSAVVTADSVRLDRTLARPILWPVTLIPMYEDKHVDISMYIMKPGTEIPLHRYPKTHGILKVLSGRVKIESFTFLLPDLQKKIMEEKCLKKNALLVEKRSDIYADGSQGHLMFSPGITEFYKIVSEAQTAAILQILLPSQNDFDPEAVLTFPELRFYKHAPVEVRYLAEPDKSISILLRTDPPRDFFLHMSQYHGPPLRKERSEEKPASSTKP